ncbi:MAG TPA: pyridoxamine 5'-phosphate oxidase family protein [bacterium]|nr:pyridoxamine 5'-phosphate oxidase family protein [bacterium]
MPEDATAFVKIQEESYARAGPGIRTSYPRSQAMDAPRLAAFLSSKRYAVCATSRPDGRPQASPVAFIIWNGAFWLASVRGARLRNLQARPYASVVIMEGEGLAHRAVMAEGPVVLHEVRSTDLVSGEFRQRWMDRHGSAPTWAAALIEIRPARLFSYDATSTAPQP